MGDARTLVALVRVFSYDGRAVLPTACHLCCSHLAPVCVFVCACAQHLHNSTDIARTTLQLTKAQNEVEELKYEVQAKSVECEVRAPCLAPVLLGLVLAFYFEPS